jgi:pimeloyl-ACP methyl ester carboxylesterase
MNEEIVELRDGRFKIRVQTAGEGEPLVALHGATGLTWFPMLDTLARTYRVIAPEHPGAGESQGLEHVEDLWDLVLYYNELFDRLGLGRVSLLGSSFGGMVAAEIAATNPERVDRLVLIAPMGLWRDDHPVPDISGVHPRTIPSLLWADPTGPVPTSIPPVDRSDPEALLRQSLTTASILQFTWPLPDKGLRKRLYRIHAPTLIVWGRCDRMVDAAYADDFAAAINGAEVVMIDNAGHLPHLEQQTDAEQAIAAFLGR